MNGCNFDSIILLSLKCFVIRKHDLLLSDRHSGSTYYRKTDKEKAEVFAKIEPYLTFLNIHQLERKGADIQSKVEELEDLNQSLRNRDKMKDDAIAQLSDQLLTISTRLQELERKQQSYVS
jgi:paraquat-inducible protein B